MKFRVFPSYLSQLWPKGRQSPILQSRDLEQNYENIPLHYNQRTENRGLMWTGEYRRIFLLFFFFLLVLPWDWPHLGSCLIAVVVMVWTSESPRDNLSFWPNKLEKGPLWPKDHRGNPGSFPPLFSKRFVIRVGTCL